MPAVGSLELSIYELATLTVLYENKGKRIIEVTDDMLADPHYVKMLKGMIDKRLITVSQPLKPRQFKFLSKPAVYIRIEGKRAYEAHLKHRASVQAPAKKMGRKVARHK